MNPDRTFALDKTNSIGDAEFWRDLKFQTLSGSTNADTNDPLAVKAERGTQLPDVPGNSRSATGSARRRRSPGFFGRRPEDGDGGISDSRRVTIKNQIRFPPWVMGAVSAPITYGGKSLKGGKIAVFHGQRAGLGLAGRW